jgi:membrane protease YdiL (CAAX protease family)
MNQSLESSGLKETNSSLTLPVIGVFTAVAATTTMDATGLSTFSAFALLPLMFLFWYLDRLSRAEIGFKWGTRAGYGIATLYPLIVMGAITVVATCARAIDFSKTNWNKAALNFAILMISTFLVAIVTEEGFFRGWLWGSLRRRRVKETHAVLWSSIAFAAWHISAVTLDPDFKPPAAQVPVFLINAAAIGAIWGLLRWISGSILVSSLSHGVWNALAYVFFGFGTRTGALGISNTAIFGPEIGILGLFLNLIFLFALWHWWARKSALTQS